MQNAGWDGVFTVIHLVQEFLGNIFNYLGQLRSIVNLNTNIFFTLFFYLYLAYE